MGSRSTREGVKDVYTAARKWVDCALLNDDSLFTPGKPIWSSQWLGKLHERFLDSKDVAGNSFDEKLQVQLEDSKPDVYQLMGEALYFYFLIVSTKNSSNEQQVIDKVLNWSPSPVVIPQEFVDGLTPGIANPGQFFHNARQYQVGFLIEFVEQWKEQRPNDRDRLLGDPWAFKDFVTAIDPQSELLRNVNSTRYRTQREAMLHLVFPDTFERIVSVPHKRSIADANALATYISEPTDDVDRKLAQIRQSLEIGLQRQFDFYDPDIRKHWDATFDSDNEYVACKLPDLPNLPVANDLQTLTKELYFENSTLLQSIGLLLKDKRQVIFQGPPGTGKTFVAQELARHLAGSEDRVTLVQFHPSYAYEDFVQGFRPSLVNGQPGFELRDGPLLIAADKARNEPHAKHFLIIDEINRGSLASVLGELYFLLEYREEEISLQYQGQAEERFSLPDNLYIIGTMNTADRSIALVDLALRRRFYFVEFHPDEEPVKSVLRNWLKKNADGMEWVADVVDAANNKLKDDRHAAIGPSYFMKPDLDRAAVERIWKHSVLPYIEERLFGDDRISEFDLDELYAAVTSASQPDGGNQGEDGTQSGGNSE